jgi:spore coat protein CotF
MGTSKNRLSDRDILLDVLMTEKHMSQVYDTAIMESTNNPILELFERMQHDEHENARTIFNAMQERRWYSANQSNEKHNPRQKTPYTNKFSSDYAVTSGSQNFGSRLHQ